jgi:type IV pilus assembly protein PilB
MASTIPGFAEILIRRKTISNEQFVEADQVARDTGGSAEDSLVKLGYATSEEVMRAVAEEHRVEYVDIARTKIPDDIIQLVPESVARENNVMPIDEIDGVLRVAIGNPSDVDTIEKLRFILNRDVRISLSPKDGIVEAINRLYGQVEGESADSILQEFTDTAIDFTETEDADFGVDEGIVDENSAPVVKLVQLMIQEAVQLRASDIHVEPFEDRVRIRYRIDGLLHERDSPPRRLLGPLLSRIKIISKIDIAERRRPQDGRIKITAGEKELDLRVSVIPTNHGQSTVMRLLDPDNIKVGIRQLGFSEENFHQFQGLI